MPTEPHLNSEGGPRALCFTRRPMSVRAVEKEAFKGGGHRQFWD